MEAAEFMLGRGVCEGNVADKWDVVEAEVDTVSILALVKRKGDYKALTGNPTQTRKPSCKS